MNAINVMTSQETNKIQNNVVYLFGNTTTTKTKANQEKREFKVKRPILDKEYLNTPSFKYIHKSQKPLSKDEIKKIKNYFYNKNSRYSSNNLRDFAYFVFSINVPFRAGDILNLKIKDVVNEDGSIKDRVIIREQKTKKLANKPVDSIAREALVEYLNTKNKYQMSDYLFTNYKTGGKLSVDGMRKVLKRMASELDLDINIGTHTLRRTWAYQASKNNPNNSKTEIMISKALNHSNVETTHIYMQKTQNEMDKFFEENAL